MCLAGLALAIVVLAGCASAPTGAPSAPDESVLQPAEQALAKARAAQADTFAPRAVDAARRRIATARDILYTAALARRPLTDEESGRVDQLVDAAELDARSALVETQAKAVETKLDELRSGGGSAPASHAGGSAGAMGVSP
ncbi:hypothetical protein [Salinisphaera sp. T31B1]|uniref:hypothetical protein n=1 Tax=Salinisphaera sp. T31B1 TaxID=727963 RepID=UPI00333E3D26